jgi:transposase
LKRKPATKTKIPRADKAIVGWRSDDVEEIDRLGDTLKTWWKEILNPTTGPVT